MIEFCVPEFVYPSSKSASENPHQVPAEFIQKDPDSIENIEIEDPIQICPALKAEVLQFYNESVVESIISDLIKAVINSNHPNSFKVIPHYHIAGLFPDLVIFITEGDKPVTFIEVKVPTQQRKSLTNSEYIMGQMYNYLKAFQTYFNIPQPRGIVTNFTEWVICELDKNDVGNPKDLGDILTDFPPQSIKDETQFKNFIPLLSSGGDEDEEEVIEPPELNEEKKKDEEMEKRKVIGYRVEIQQGDPLGNISKHLASFLASVLRNSTQSRYSTPFQNQYFANVKLEKGNYGSQISYTFGQLKTTSLVQNFPSLNTKYFFLLQPLGKGADGRVCFLFPQALLEIKEEARRKEGRKEGKTK